MTEAQLIDLLNESGLHYREEMKRHNDALAILAELNAKYDVVGDRRLPG